MTQGQLSDLVKFLIGIVHIGQLVDKPSIAIGIGILDGSSLTTL